MVGVIAPSSRLNSLGSICYCFLALGLHIYSVYAIILRYQEAEERTWSSNGEIGGTPVECTLLLVFAVLASLMIPFFCITCFIKVGNLANDQIQLGFHHALAPAAPLSTTALSKENMSTPSFLWKAAIKRCWSHFCPISPFIHLVSAFLLVFPQALLTPVEVEHKYLSTVMCWSSELDFLYPSQRILLSDVKSIVNMSEVYNASNTVLPSSPIYTGSRSDHVTVSVAFVNFSLAFATYIIRYASVFWYTNKVLSLIFTIQLVGMVLTNIFGFCSFSVLYCVCYNRKVFRNVHLSIGCGVDIVLYLFSGLILLLSSVLVFEYGTNHFNRKFKIVERHHNADNPLKKGISFRFTSGCQGHVPHSCAMASLIALAVFKGPLLYDLVSLMRHTGDNLLLSGIVCDVCYMVLWVVLWLGLTIKQEWQFRILDFVPSSQPRYSLPLEETGSSKSSQMGQAGDDLEIEQYLQRRRPNVPRDNSQRYSDPLPAGLRTSGDLYQQSDVGTEGSDNTALDMAATDIGEVVGISDQIKAPIRIRRVGGQRVTFDESIRSRGSAEEPRSRSLPRQRGYESKQNENHVNVTADIHALEAPRGFQDGESSQPQSVVRQLSPDSSILTREYRNSLRNKCGEYYSSNGNLNELVAQDETPGISGLGEPLPTLMSSFRDKVRESSIAASNFKEREKNMIERYNAMEQSSAPRHQAEGAEADLGSRQLPDGIVHNRELDLKGHLNTCDNFSRDAHRLSNRHYDPDRDCNSLPKRLNASVSSDEGHQSSFTPSNADSFDNNCLPPVYEDNQLSAVRSGDPARDYRHMNGTAGFRPS